MRWHIQGFGLHHGRHICYRTLHYLVTQLSLHIQSGIHAKSSFLWVSIDSCHHCVVIMASIATGEAPLPVLWNATQRDLPRLDMDDDEPLNLAGTDDLQDDDGTRFSRRVVIH